MMDFYNPNEYWKHHDPYNGLTDRQRMKCTVVQFLVFFAFVIAAIAILSIM